MSPVQRAGILPAALALLALSWIAIFLLDPWADERVSDLFLFHSTAELFLDGFLPYRDVPFEYPPLAAPVIALPGLAGGGEDGYRLAFGLLMAALAAAAIVLAGRLATQTGGDRRLALLAMALAPLLTGAMVRTHFDLAAVVLVLAALSAILSGRTGLGFACLGAGAMLKLFPLVVAPIALAWLLAREERGVAVRGAAVLGLTLAALALPALVLSPEGALDAVRYQAERPVQVESSPATVLLALDAVGGGAAQSVHSHRSDGLEHAGSELVVALFAGILIGVVALLAVAATRPSESRDSAPRALVLASLAAVAAVAAFGKVLSPQFLVWALPLLALALAWRLYPLAAAGAAAVVLTFVEFPARYFDVVAREPLPVALVAGRNLALLGAVALAGRALLRGGSSARAGAVAPRRA